MNKQDHFLPMRDFSSLSVRDLLEAREAYHVHLAHHENVVATAIGRFRIRKDDDDARDPKTTWSRASRSYRKSSPRTLQNTIVTEWSWPCLLVFIRQWLSPEDFREKQDQVIPRFLYMPDGRVVPTCVVLAPEHEVPAEKILDITFPDKLIGGGYPVLTRVQEQQHIGSIACLVTDGNSTYALTARHVAGEPGSPAFSLIDAENQQIGVADLKQVGKLPFSEVYPGWPGTRASANLDAALIRLADVSYWTAQVFGVGEIDEPVDLHVDTISLDLIGCPVKAFGCASGEMTGEIQALFYRYRAIGGFDYIADMLIGGRGKNPINTRPGDSGTMWFFDPEISSTEAKANGSVGARARRFRPVALQWGGHRVMGAEHEAELQFALATCVSTICRTLDVEIIRDWNIGMTEYWGQVGHYKIGFTACGLLSDAKLQTLFGNNRDRIGIADAGIENGDIGNIVEDRFVPLANVPDDVWKQTRERPKDNANHFADMDEEGKGDFAGTTLIQLSSDPAKVDATVWNAFYDSIGVNKRGALPFRVWQIYNEMVEFVSAGKVPEYVCAAGILAHYVGDACQPLHASRLHDGDPNVRTDRGVHSAYETLLLNRFAVELIVGVNNELNGRAATPDVEGGHAAAVSIVSLLKRTADTLSPMEIIEAFRSASGRQRLTAMWATLGDRTIKCMADGSLHLAMLWESAWREGGGENIPSNQLAAANRRQLKQLYSDKEFLRSYTLDELEQQGIIERPSA
jgi:hypothetical protein